MAHSSQNIPQSPPRLIFRELWRTYALKSALFFALCIFLSFACCQDSSYAETDQPKEYEVKAALIFTIIKFVDWPESGAGKVSPLCIAVLGQDPFGNDLEKLQGKIAKGRPIIVKHFKRAEDAKGCEVLYISSSEKPQLHRIVRHLKNSPVLTISDQKGFCQSGGMINLVLLRNKVNFEINNSAAQQSNIRISSKLLKLAKFVIE